MFAAVAKYHALRRRLLADNVDTAAVFTTEVNVLASIALVGSGLPVVVSERSDPAVIPRGWSWRVMRRVAYQILAPTVVVQSDYAENYFRQRSVRCVRAIPNPLSVPRRNVDVGSTNSSLVQVICVGRLVQEKRYDLFLQAVRGLADAGRAACARFAVVGDGPELERLIELAEELDIASVVNFPGYRKNPWEGVRAGDIYVQCSDVEGAPNAMLEAMVLGCAVVTTRYSAAAEEYIAAGVNGLVVACGDPRALGWAITRLIDDPVLRRQLGVKAARSLERHDTEVVADAWEDVLSRAHSRAQRRVVA